MSHPLEVSSRHVLFMVMAEGKNHQARCTRSAFQVSAFTTYANFSLAKTCHVVEPKVRAEATVKCNEPQYNVSSREELGPLIQSTKVTFFLIVSVYVCFLYLFAILSSSNTTLVSLLGYLIFALQAYFGLHN